MAATLKATSSKVLDDLKLPRFYLIVANIAKKNNIGTMLRSSSAFGVKEVIITGNKKNIQFFGAQGTTKHVPFRYFNKLREAVDYVKEECDCTICGVEIKPSATSVTEHPFRGNTAFMLGNEGIGLSACQAALCDYFVYIPHYGDGTASLNVTVAASIVFHHFGVWAKYPEHARQDEKFVVKDLPKKSGAETEQDQALQRLRRQNRESQDNQEVTDLGGLF